VDTIDVDYADYPANTKFVGDILETSPTGTGNFYSISTVPSDQLNAVETILRNYRPCFNLSTEDKVFTSCDGDGLISGRLRIDAIISAASDPDIRVVAPGEVIALYGAFPGAPSSAGTLVNQPWALSLNGLEVTIGGEVTEGCGTNNAFPACKVVSGRRAPIAFVNRSQINVQVPFDTPAGSQPVRFWNRNPSPTRPIPGTPPFYSAAFPLQVSAVAPAIFLTEGGPQVYGPNGSQNTPDNAAGAGDILTIYATGLGQTTVPLEAGRPAPEDVRTVSGVTVSIDGVEVPARSAQAVPTSIGIYSVTFSVPGGIASGARQFTLRVGGQASKAVNVWFR
jgi:uncharacterized protein (TIGR03437 family)